MQIDLGDKFPFSGMWWALYLEIVVILDLSVLIACIRIGRLGLLKGSMITYKQ